MNKKPVRDFFFVVQMNGLNNVIAGFLKRRGSCGCILTDNDGHC